MTGLLLLLLGVQLTMAVFSGALINIDKIIKSIIIYYKNNIAFLKTEKKD